jgi:hypothetical protein
MVMLTVWANFLNRNLCPLNWLLASLASMSPGTRYLFPKIVNGHVDDGADLTPSEESERWRQLCMDSDLTIIGRDGKEIAAYTTHSSRHTFAFWAKLCGIANDNIKIAGRWCSFSSFMIYINLGLNDASHDEVSIARALDLGLAPDLMSARSILLDNWKWQDPLPQHFTHFDDGVNPVLSARANLNPGIF